LANLPFLTQKIIFLPWEVKPGLPWPKKNGQKFPNNLKNNAQRRRTPQNNFPTQWAFGKKSFLKLKEEAKKLARRELPKFLS